MEIHLKQSAGTSLHPLTPPQSHKILSPLSILASQNICSHGYHYGHFCKDSPGCRQPGKKSPKVSG